MWSIFEHMMYSERSKKEKYIKKELNNIENSLYKIAQTQKDKEEININMNKIRKLFNQYL
mgnify:CR=1 FL=1